MKAAKTKINKSLQNNYYLQGREWPYKNVKPRILAEKYMVDESGFELKDYKLKKIKSQTCRRMAQDKAGIKNRQSKMNNWQLHQKDIYDI